MEVASLLDKLGDLVEANGDDRFKVIAYHRAATSVRNLEEDIETLWREGRLEEIKYVGSGIAKKVAEYLDTGKVRLVEELEEKVPAGATTLTKVQGIGPRTEYKLTHDFGIRSVDELKAALNGGRLDGLFGQGVREDLKAAIARAGESRRMLLPEAEGAFQTLAAYFEALGIGVEMAGSLRRGKSTIGDLDLISTDRRAIDATAGCPGVSEVIEKGPKRASVRLDQGTQVDVRIFTEEELGAARIYFTGSKDHNIALRTIAVENGWKLNEYGLFDVAGKRVGGGRQTEVQIYKSLGLEFIPPELRENTGEIDAAKEGRLPELVRLDQMRGDLQVHTTWSDGTAEVSAMAKGAKARGYDYVGFTDHSVSVRVANGLTEERFRRQWKEIDGLNEELKPFKILKGVEVEIKSDGTLDFSRGFLDLFDYVGASLHQSFRQSPEKLTERAVAALKHPSVDFLCHPTNRLIGRRQGNPIDLKKVVRVAKDNGKALEVDGEPDRLDLDEFWAKRAVEEGVPLVIDSDAHSVEELDNIAYGVLVARRGWVETTDVMNTRGLGSLLKAFS